MTPLIVKTPLQDFLDKVNLLIGFCVFELIVMVVIIWVRQLKF